MASAHTQNRLHIVDGRKDCLGPRRSSTIEIEKEDAVDSTEDRVVTTCFMQGIMISVIKVRSTVQYQYELVRAGWQNR